MGFAGEAAVGASNVPGLGVVAVGLFVPHAPSRFPAPGFGVILRGPDSPDPIDRVSSRPDFLVLCYPVISFLTFAHQGSKRNLLGDNPDPKLVENLSNETQVTARTPPTFLFNTTTDATVPVENSVMFYSALRKAGVPAELHIYEQGPHGVGLAQIDEGKPEKPPTHAASLLPELLGDVFVQLFQHPRHR